MAKKSKAQSARDALKRYKDRNKMVTGYGLGLGGGWVGAGWSADKVATDTLKGKDITFKVPLTKKRLPKYEAGAGAGALAAVFMLKDSQTKLISALVLSGIANGAKGARVALERQKKGLDPADTDEDVEVEEEDE